MSELKDDEATTCSACGYKLQKITLCNSIMNNACFNSIQYNRRCPTIICNECKYCSNCDTQIKDRKKRMICHRYEKGKGSDSLYYSEKSALLRFFGVDFDCNNDQ